MENKALLDIINCLLNILDELNRVKEYTTAITVVTTILKLTEKLK